MTILTCTEWTSGSERWNGAAYLWHWRD